MSTTKVKRIVNPLKDINYIMTDGELSDEDLVDGNLNMNKDKSKTKGKIKKKSKAKTKDKKKSKKNKKAKFKDPFQDMRFDDLSDEEETKMKHENLPWIEKYRPDSLNEIVSHDKIVDILNKFIKNRTLPHLLFHGPPGTGKTSTITACAKRLYGEYFDLMVLELNASYDRGVETVREKIKRFINAKNDFFGNKKEKDIFKLVILDETDSMTVDAQAILKQIMEKYMKTVRFCLICNYIHKIEWALRSRCTKFRFSPLTSDQVTKKVKYVIKEENININKDGVKTLIERSNGDMRQVFNTLQSITNIHKKKITETHINNFLGYPNKDIVLSIVNHLVKSSFNKSLKVIKEFQDESGLSINDLINEIYKLLMSSILKTGKDYFSKYKLEQKTKMLTRMAQLQYNYVTTGKNVIQTGTLVGIFSLGRKTN